MSRVAVLLDGGFVRKRLESLKRAQHRRDGVAEPTTEQVFPTASDFLALCGRIAAEERLRDCELFRIYYYDAPPLSGQKLNPLSRKSYSFDGLIHKLNQRLQETLAQTSDFAVRRGDTVFRGWRVRNESLEELTRRPRAITAEDLGPNIGQKGVDLRIGLDVALLSVRRIVDIIVLVTGDSDFIPALKFARREGLRVYLDTMGAGVRPGLTEHADFVFNSSSRLP